MMLAIELLLNPLIQYTEDNLSIHPIVTGDGRFVVGLADSTGLCQ